MFISYREKLVKALNDLVIDQWDKAIPIIQNAVIEDKLIFTIGNGGSSSTSSHLATDLSKGLSLKLNRKVKTLSLNDNNSLMTAISNDISFSNVFEFQLNNFSNPGDLLIAISGSGNSENILNAVRYAKKNNIFVIGLVGFDGGRLKNLVDHAIHVEINDMQIVEDIHAIFGHFILQNLNIN